MSKTSENLSRLEQDAQELVMKLRTLNEQIGSYKEAKNSLQETSQNLGTLVHSITQLTQQSQSIISKFNEISGIGFIEQTKQINTNMTSEHKQLIAYFQGIGKNLSEAQSQMLSCITEANKKNKIFLFVIIAGMVIIVLINLTYILFVR